MQRPSRPANDRVGRVIGYARVSTEKQGDRGASLEAQRADIERFCAGRGLPKPRIEVEIEGAGRERQERRVVLRRILDELRDGDRVVVAKIDRFSRDTRFTLEAIDRFRVARAKLLSVTENIDPDTHDGYLFLTILAGFAKREKERILERTIEVRRGLREQGHFVEGIPPLGYRLEKRKLVIVPEKAAIVRKMFARNIAGDSVRKIGEMLRREHGIDYDAGGVHYVLRNRIYLGENQTAAGRELVDERPIGKRWGSGEWISTHEPIIDRATFEASRRALESRRRAGRPPGQGATAKWLLAGIAQCAVCGRRMSCIAYGTSRSPNPSHAGWYICSLRAYRRGQAPCENRAVRRDDVDEQIRDATLAQIARLRKALERAPTRAKAEAAPDFTARRTRVAQSRSRIVEAFSDGDISRDDLRTRLAKLDTELVTIDVDEAEFIDRAKAQQADTPAARARAVAKLGSMAKLWAVATDPERRAILQALAERIEILQGKAAITWRDARALLADSV